jgi:CelD/BcsL family acetyltransferase involved in cellulose biosynthesis
VPPAPQPDLRIEALDPTDARWDAYVEAHPDGLVYHRAGWLRSLAREYPRNPVLALAALSADEIRGVLPLQETRGLPIGPREVVGRRLASLPRTPAAGPLASDKATADALLAAAFERAQATGGRLQVKLCDPTGVTPPPGGAVHPWRVSFAIDLPEREQDVRFGNSRNHGRIRWSVNKAHKSGMRVVEATTPEDVRRWYPLYLEALRFNVVPPRSLRFFLAVWEELAPSGAASLLLARDAAGRDVAGAMVLASGSTAFYAFNGVRRSAFSLRPNDLIQWEAIHRAVRSGHRVYDLGEVVEGDGSLADFKRKWGAEGHRMYRLYHPAPAHAPDTGASQPGGAHELAHRAYRRLPLRATALVGDGLYRFL